MKLQVHELCMKRIHVTKRDLFYTDVKLFEAKTHTASFKLQLHYLLVSRFSASTACSTHKPLVNLHRCRSKATPMQCWMMLPACWAARAPAFTVSLKITLAWVSWQTK